MADFVAVLRKTIDGLGETTPEMRRKVYDKARATVSGKLAQINPPPPPAVAERQRKALEDAIILVEAEHTAAESKPAEPKAPDPLDDLEAIFAKLKETKPKPNGKAAIPAALAVPKPAKTDHPLPSGLVGTVKPAAPPPPEMLPSEEPAKPPFAEDEEFSPAPRRHRRGRGWIAALVILIAVAAAAYGVWFKRQDLAAALGVDLPRFARVGSGPAPASAPAASKSAATAPAQPANGAAKPAGTMAAAEQPAAPKPPAPPPANSPAAQSPAKAPAPAEVQKFTQRLAADGSETDPGPAGGEVKIGEGTSLAAATTPPSKALPDSPAPASGAQPAATPSTTQAGAPAANASSTQLPVGQRAIFYEERTSADQGSAQTGSIVWSLVKESPGGDLPPEPAIRAEATIPGKDLQLRMTIRRNADQTLPASHIIELIFLTPDNFEGGGIDGVLRIAMKDSEQAPGSPLLGIPAKISDGFFLVALNDDKASVATNINLLKQQDWIDIPVVYKSGRRALITMEKGIPGDKVFDEALKAWQSASSG
jgi:hypothetical protein